MLHKYKDACVVSGDGGGSSLAGAACLCTSCGGAALADHPGSGAIGDALADNPGSGASAGGSVLTSTGSFLISTGGGGAGAEGFGGGKGG